MLPSAGHALIDLMTRSIEKPPQVGEKVLCRHPFQESKRAYVIPKRVEPLYKVKHLIYLFNMIKNILTRRKESDTYLATVSRHRWSRQIAMKIDKI